MNSASVGEVSACGYVGSYLRGEGEVDERGGGCFDGERVGLVSVGNSIVVYVQVPCVYQTVSAAEEDGDEVSVEDRHQWSWGGRVPVQRCEPDKVKGSVDRSGCADLSQGRDRDGEYSYEQNQSDRD